jgi:hypothetical protein
VTHNVEVIYTELRAGRISDHRAVLALYWPGTVMPMFAWIQRRIEETDLVKADAGELMRLFGAGAYDDAGGHARLLHAGIGILRRNGHGDRVGREIGRRTRYGPLDTATRYLGNQNSQSRL